MGIKRKWPSFKDKWPPILYENLICPKKAKKNSYLLSAFYCVAVGAKSKRKEEFFPRMIVSLDRMYLTTYFERGQTADGTQSVDHTAALCPVFPTCAECGVPIAKHE